MKYPDITPKTLQDRAKKNPDVAFEKHGREKKNPDVAFKKDGCEKKILTSHCKSAAPKKKF